VKGLRHAEGLFVAWFLETGCCSTAAPQQDWLVEVLVWKAPTMKAAFCSIYRCAKVKLGTLLLLCLLSALPRISSHAQAQQPIPTEFTNSTAAAGIRFAHLKGNSCTSINREEFGPGVCMADFDGDGWPDIYFVNGRDLYHRGVSVRNALYRNNGDGTFTDVTKTSRQ
jgi:FG-GAP-like repeat